MGFSFIKKKSQAMGKKSMASTIKVNKYEIPQMALDLVANICTQDNTTFQNELYSLGNLILNILRKIKDEISKKEEELKDTNISFPWLKTNFLVRNGKIIHTPIIDIVEEMFSDILNSSSPTLKIAVAGGYSAGKSSLLNMISDAVNLLPMGIEPVSVVNTNLNCSTTYKQLTIFGRNLKDSPVMLNKDVLACIQHSSKSNIHLTSVLKKLIINIPTKKDYLDRITFIDTPGYNNSNNSNKENNKTDRETALESFKEADVIFWCVDIEAGTISKEDLNILKNDTLDKPIVIFFTKMDKKSDNEAKKIVKEAHVLCSKELRFLEDVQAISCIEKNSYSIQYSSLNQLFITLKEKKGQVKDAAYYQKEIDDLFKKEIQEADDTYNQYNQKRMEDTDNKDKEYQDYLDLKKRIADYGSYFKELIITSYNDNLTVYDETCTQLQDAIEGWEAALKREDDWSSKSGMFSDTTRLQNRMNRAINNYNKLLEAIEDTASFNYYKEEERKDSLKYITDVLEGLLGCYESSYKNAEEACKNDLDILQATQWYKNLLTKYRPEVEQAVKEIYTSCVSRMNNYLLQLQAQQPETNDDINIFDAVMSDNLSNFYSCFSQGVNLEECNSEGYSPLTWTAKSGNNEMMKFFIKHEADLSLKDKRGYNALETAAIYHYQDICQLLMEADNSLVSKSQSLTELAKKNKFENWIAQFN